MQKPNTYVVKFGGSILSGPLFIEWVDALLKWSTGKQVYDVPGGGAIADAIRGLQATTGMSELTAHQLAIAAMRQVAAVICEAGQQRFGWTNLSDSKMRTDSVGLFLWVPERTEYDVSGMPKDWSVTSDSIALWFANYLQATELVLLKSVAPRTGDPRAWSADAYVDGYFPKLLPQTVCPVRAVWELGEL